MSYNYQNLSLLDARALMLYASQLDLKIANTFGVYSGGNKLRFSREEREEDEYPYISATPTQYITGGQVSQSRYIATDIIGKELTMTHTNVNLPDFVDFAFSLESYAMKDTDNGITIEFEKNDGSEFTVASVQYIIANQTAFRLFGKKINGTVEVINAGYFDRYTTNTQTGNRWYSDRPNNIFTETVSISTILGHSSSQIFEGCAPILKTNCRVFKNDEYAQNYLLTGTIEGEVTDEEDEEPEEPEEFESDVYFYEVFNEYYSDLALTNHILTTNQKYTITFEDYPKGTTPIHAQLINNKYMNNVQFIVANGYGQYITSASSRIGNIEVPITENILSTFMGIRTNYGILEDTINDRYCKTTVYTNMPIIGVDGSALPGRIPDSDDMIGAENGANYECGLSECWLLDTENVSKLASIFNTTIDRSSSGASELVLAEWVQGLSCYSNPLDVVCDLFYMPINVSDYITGSSKSFTLQPSING